MCECPPNRARTLHVHMLCGANEHDAHENGALSQASSHELATSCRIICKSDEDFLSLYLLNKARSRLNMNTITNSHSNCRISLYFCKRAARGR